MFNTDSFGVAAISCTIVASVSLLQSHKVKDCNWVETLFGSVSGLGCRLLPCQIGNSLIGDITTPHI